MMDYYWYEHDTWIFASWEMDYVVPFGWEMIFEQEEGSGGKTRVFECLEVSLQTYEPSPAIRTTRLH